MLDSIDALSRISRKLLIDKEVKFEFDGDCVKAFNCLKELLVSAPIIVALD